MTNEIKSAKTGTANRGPKLKASSLYCSWRPNDEEKRMMLELVQLLGVSQSDINRQAIRLMYAQQREFIPAPDAV
jgi:hypothetical protein